MKLSTNQLRYLRGLTHDLKPVVRVGDKGLTENVLNEIEIALDRHELIKIKLRADRETRQAWADEIATRCGALPVHAIGQVACYFRRNPDLPSIELPEAARKASDR